MKHYYRMTDAIIQAVILAAWLVAYLAGNNTAFSFYFITGAWHLVSLLVHVFISSKKYKNTYRTFFAIVCGIVTIFCLGFVLPVIMMVELYILLFVSPLFALLYTAGCFFEIRYLNKRPISYLK